MADWNANVSSTAAYISLLTLLAARDVDAVTLGKTAYTNPPDGAVEYNRAGVKFREWSSGGSSWSDIVIAIAGGGTGASSASGARTNLGLGTMATQNASSVSISGGSVAASLTGSTNIDSGALVNATGHVPTAVLGSGAASNTTFLRGDQTWATITINLKSVVVTVKTPVRSADFTVDFSSDTEPLTGSHTASLPTVVGNGGKRVTLVMRGTGTWNIAPNGAETILGANPFVFNWGQYSSITLEADANSGLWDII